MEALPHMFYVGEKLKYSGRLMLEKLADEGL